MNAAGGTISVLVGTALLRLTFTGTYRRYVREGMGPLLAVAGIAVILLGLVTLVRALRTTPAGDAGGHDGRVAAGWLLLAPISALLLVAPPTLGSFGVGRGASVDVRSGAPVFDPIARDDAARPMTLLEFGQRAFDHDGASFNGATVEVTGFVAGAEAGGFPLARYQIACCAADATPVVIRVLGVVGDPPGRDQWVKVTGVFEGVDDDDVPELAATSVKEITPPDDPYE